LWSTEVAPFRVFVVSFTGHIFSLFHHSHLPPSPFY
jgi:hypothetical protein